MAKYCTHCGKEIGEEAVVCVNCGCAVEDRSPRKADSDSIGWGFLGFFISLFFSPVAGLILWLVWKDDSPKKAKNVGIGTLIAVALPLIALFGWGIYAAVALMIALSSAGATASLGFEMVRMLVSSLTLI